MEVLPDQVRMPAELRRVFGWTTEDFGKEGCDMVWMVIAHEEMRFMMLVASPCQRQPRLTALGGSGITESRVRDALGRATSESLARRRPRRRRRRQSSRSARFGPGVNAKYDNPRLRR